MKKTGKRTIQRIASAFLAFAMAVSVSGMGEVEAAKPKKHIAVIYFSATGTTKGAAKKIQKSTKGKLLEIKAADPYTEEELDYTDDDSRVSKERDSAPSPAKSKVRPEIANLKAIKKAIKKADVIYLGYPIWNGEAPHILYTLVEQVSLKGKTVVPFCTSASSGMGSSAKHLKANAKISSKTKWLKGRNFYEIPSQKTVDRWIKKLKY